MANHLIARGNTLVVKEQTLTDLDNNPKWLINSERQGNIVGTISKARRISIEKINERIRTGYYQRPERESWINRKLDWLDGVYFGGIFLGFCWMGVDAYLKYNKCDWDWRLC